MIGHEYSILILLSLYESADIVGKKQREHKPETIKQHEHLRQTYYVLLSHDVDTSGL